MDGIDCQLLERKGLSCYNMALGGSSVSSSAVMLEEYLATCKSKPTTILFPWGTYMASLNDYSIHPIIQFTRLDLEWSLRELPIIKFKWLGIEFLKKIVSEPHRDAYLKNGQLRFSKVRRDETKVGTLNQLDLQSYKNSAQLRKLIKLCEDNNIRLVVIEMPGFKKTRNKTSSGPHFLWESDHVLLYNLNSVSWANHFDEGEYWIGNSHLNEDGARVFTAKLFQLLKNDQIF
jgi:hypothetical protein